MFVSTHSAHPALYGGRLCDELCALYYNGSNSSAITVTIKSHHKVCREKRGGRHHELENKFR